MPSEENLTSAQTRFRGLIRALGQTMEPQSEDNILPDGHIMIVDGTLELTMLLNEQPDEVRLSAPIGDLTGSESPAFLRTLLDANLFWAGTGGATIALENGTSRLFLQDKRHLGIEDREFTDWIDKFIGVAQAWTRAIANQMTSGSSESHTASPTFLTRA